MEEFGIPFERALGAPIDRAATLDCVETKEFPQAKKVVSPLIQTEDEARSFIGEHIRDFPFVKLCTLSPKDTNTLLFKTADAAIQALRQSARTSSCICDGKWPHSGGYHIIMKERRDYVASSRCFVVGGVVTLVSGNITPADVCRFMDSVARIEPPVDDYCMEIGEFIDAGTNKHIIEVIEFNAIDCDPDPLTWCGNWYEILNMENNNDFRTIWCDPQIGTIIDNVELSCN